MAADFKFEVTREAILDFLQQRGGKVKNTDLIEHFQAVFPEEAEERAAARAAFKDHVDGVAFVKAESGVKYVCLRKKFRGSEPDRASGPEELTCRHEPAQPPGGAARQRTPPGSGYGSGSQVGVPHVFSPGAALPDGPDDKSKCHESVCVAEAAESDSGGEMGGGQSVRRASRRSGKERVRSGPDLPQITVIEASPLPAAGAVFALPAPAQTEGLKGAERVNVVVRRQSSKGSQHRGRRPLSDDGEDARSLSGSDGNASPKGSRVHFLEAMMNSSPQLRRSVALRSSVYLSARGGDGGDSISLASSAPDEDRAAVALDPLEHEWMMCSSDGEWSSLRRLLATEPSLVLRKDFVTGFTCLHWAAKHGKPELLALLINFARQRGVPISVDARSGSGYTPLHVAAMQNHVEVVKLLVGAYNADVEIRDYSGRKACQYLTGNVGSDIRDIIGASEPGENVECGDGGRSRLSRVLQSNLRPLRLLGPDDCDSTDGEVRPREKPVRRKSSFSRMKPKLEKLRWRTSQIVHSTSFREGEELEGSLKGSFKSRPKTHFFG